MFVAEGSCMSIRDCASIRTYTVYSAFDWKAGCMLHDFQVECGCMLNSICFIVSVGYSRFG